MTFTTLSLVLFLVLGFLLVTGGKHSLLYLYTIQSKHSDSHIHDSTAVTLLDDRQIDFYNSTDESRTAKQNWLKNIPESDWKTRTEKLKYDTQLLNKLIDIQIDDFRHSHSDGHVLQWRHGCEGEQSSDGSLTVLNTINEFGYDGEDLIQLNCTSKTWITPEKKKNREREEKKNREREEEKNREREEKWSKIFYAVKKCMQCEEILKMYLKYNTTDITPSHTPPAVHVFKKKSVQDSSKLILTCLITGFYPKDVKMSVRKFTTSLPEHMITSSGVRPNDDGTYQLRKSVEIPDEDSAYYDCYVNHITLRGPVIYKWVKPKNGAGPALIGGAVGGVIVILLILLAVLFGLKKKGIIGGAGRQQVIYTVPQDNAQRVPANPPRPDVPNGHGNGDANVPLLPNAPNGDANDVNVPINTEEPNGEGPKNGSSDSDSGRGSNSSQGSDENI